MAGDGARARAGYARSIGVTNFDAGELDALLAVAEVPPVVDQVQFSPFKYRRALLEACEQREVVLEAYSPLGTGRHLRTRACGRSPSAAAAHRHRCLLRWCVQRDIVVIPKSTQRERIAENAADLRLRAVR